jgi:hypothetical protein
MAKTWIPAAQQLPPKDDTVKLNLAKPISCRVIIFYYNRIINKHYTEFARFFYKNDTWLVEGVMSSLTRESVLYWCEIPEFTGEMKTLIKQSRRKVDTDGN